MKRPIAITWTAILLASSTSLDLKAASPATVPEDLSFSKEVLILHHSHVDVGYTHPQSSP